MAKPGTNKERCKRYTASGHREANKARRQENDKKRTARFAKRREEGKTYEWKPNPFDPEREKRKYVEEARIRAEKNKDHRDSVSRWRSIVRKIDNELAEEAAREKKELKAINKKG